MPYRKIAIFALMSVSLLTRAQTIKLLLGGDLMQHQPQMQYAYDNTDKQYHYDYCFQWVKEITDTVDFAIANLETTLAGKPYTGYPCFSAPDDYAIAIRNAGFQVLTTANNHCLDKGARGLTRTLQVLDNLGVKAIGTYLNEEDRVMRYPQILCKQGRRIAILSYTYGTNGITIDTPYIVNYIDTTIIKRDITHAKLLNAEAIIAIMHWGNEYSVVSITQRKLAQWLVNQGVDHIIGMHPHVPQDTVTLYDNDGKPHFVAYSLGNFLSNQSDKKTDEGYMVLLTLQFDKEQTYQVQTIPYKVLRPQRTSEKNYRIVPQ